MQDSGPRNPKRVFGNNIKRLGGPVGWYAIYNLYIKDITSLEF